MEWSGTTLIVNGQDGPLKVAEGMDVMAGIGGPSILVITDIVVIGQIEFQDLKHQAGDPTLMVGLPP